VELAASRAVALFLEGGPPRPAIEITCEPAGLELVLRGRGSEGLSEGLSPAALLALGERVALAGGTVGASPPPSSACIRVSLPARAGTVPAVASPASPPVIPESGQRLRRLAELPWPALLAASAFVLLEVEVQTSGLLRGPRLLNLLGGLAVAAPLAWCRRRPLIVTTASLLAALAMSLTLTPVGSMAAASALYLILPFSAAAFGKRMQALAGLAICGAVLFASGWLRLPGTTSILDAASIAPFVLGAWVAGLVVHDRSRLAGNLRETNERLAQERDASAREVVLEERARVARDLHDVVGHSLTVIILQAGAARRVWVTDRPTALASLANAARVARGGLTELLHSLDELDASDRPADDVGGLEEFDAILEMAKLAGVRLELKVEGQRARLSPPAELASHRVVQEALTNAIKHAPGSPVMLVVHYGKEMMELEVSNKHVVATAGSVAGKGGHGLLGMRQRVEACGGGLEWGRCDGRFSVRAWLPLLD
jgi:signal transduction histidine kinase